MDVFGNLRAGKEKLPPGGIPRPSIWNELPEEKEFYKLQKDIRNRDDSVVHTIHLKAKWKWGSTN